jgi:hypothetical protein
MRRGVGIVAAIMLLVFGLAVTADAATVGPSSKDYGSANVGTTSAASSFTLTTSANFCTIDPITMTGCQGGTETHYSTDTSALGGGPGTTNTSGDFLIHNQTCPYPSYPSPAVVAAPAGIPGNCSFEVSFAPTAGGALSKTLTFTDNGGLTASLSLTGTGIAPAAPGTTTTTPTGQQAAAIKRCKKKFPKGTSKRRKCLRHARLLPV